jgi:hypothetical protein
VRSQLAQLAVLLGASALAGCTPRTPPGGPLRIDVVNDSSAWVVVSVATDAGAAMPGFLPGLKGTILVSIGDSSNGVGVEVLGDPACGVLAEDHFPSEVPFTLILDDAEAGSGITLSIDEDVSSGMIPVPQNQLHCPAG